MRQRLGKDAEGAFEVAALIDRHGRVIGSKVVAVRRSANLLSLPPRGVEPLSENSQVVNPSQVTEKPENVLAVCLALLEQKSPELAGIVRAWPELPDGIKAGIMAMVTATATPGI